MTWYTFFFQMSHDDSYLKRFFILLSYLSKNLFLKIKYRDFYVKSHLLISPKKKRKEKEKKKFDSSNYLQ